MQKRGFNIDRFGSDPTSYSDLAIERGGVSPDMAGVKYRSRPASIGRWEEIKIFSEEAAKSIGRPCGSYDTLTVDRMDLLTDDEIEDAADEVARKLCEVCSEADAAPEKILVVGLGNRSLTPDSIGPKTVEVVKPTMHIREFDEGMFSVLECSAIATIAPGVSATSGLESAEIIKGVCQRITPDIIIAVDSIASRSVERLGSTVQISSTGIFPGSGVGNHRKAISEETVGAPVISIGIPTVIDSRVFSNGADDESMLVAPKEIDEITTVGARIIGGAINQAFGI